MMNDDDFSSTWGDQSPSALPPYTPYQEENPFASSGSAPASSASTSTATWANTDGGSHVGDQSSHDDYPSDKKQPPPPSHHHHHHQKVTSPSASSSLSRKYDITVTVCNPEKHGEGTVDAYITYEVVTKTSLQGYAAPELSVRRRYQDFVWLKTELDKENPACIVPPIPEKQRLDYMDRFSALFIEKRQAALQRFFDRLTTHAMLHRSEILRLFLESKPAAFETLKQGKRGKAFSELGDSFMNAFNKVKFPDSRFVSLAEYNQKLLEHLGSMEKVHQRLAKRQGDMCEDLTNLGSVFNLLSSEDSIGAGFHKLGQITDRNALALKEMNEKVELDIMGQFRDYFLYCESLRNALRQRDIQQVEYEELTASLEQKLAEREALTNPQASKSWMSSLTGPSDPQKLQEAIDELQRAVDESSENHKKANNIVIQEMEHFNAQKTHDFKLLLHEYASSQVQYAQRMLDQWQEILPTIEELKVD